MKQMACFKEFAKYTMLNILGMLGLSFYILADTFFISKELGADGLAALNLAIPIYSFINGSGLMLGMGGAIKYSIFMGQNKRESANSIFTTAMLITLCFSGFFFLTGSLFSETIAQMLGARGAVFDMTRTYLHVILLFSPMFLLNNLLLCFVRNDGAPHLSMAAMLGGSLSNIVLDYIFIFPLQMGILGAVLATGLAPVISIFIMSPFFFKRKNRFHIIACRLTSRRLAAIVSGGFPSLITELASGVVIIVFNMIILQLEGNTGVAAYGVIANLSLVVTAVYTGIAQGIQPIISKNYGMGNHSNIHSVFRFALVTASLVSVIVYCSVYFGASQIALAFNHEQNALLQEIAVRGLKIYFTGCVFTGFNIILSVYFTSVERVLPAHMISVLRGFIIIIPLAFFLSCLGGMTGIWCVFPATELIVAGAGCMALKKYHLHVSPNI